MGWRDWFRGSGSEAPTAPSTIRALDARGDGHMAVKGESFYAAELERVTGGGTGERTLDLLLVRDPDNPHDANCIAVRTIEGSQLGNLSRENAARFAPGLDANGGVALVGGRLRRSDPSRNWNVVLKVDYGVLENL